MNGQIFYKKFIPNSEKLFDNVSFDNFNQKVFNDFNNTDDLFNYIYSVLNSRQYKKKYSAELLKGSPRIPNLKNKEKYINIGRQLIDLHLNYENQPFWEGVDVQISEPNYNVKKMKHPKKGVLDTIIYNESITIKNIPEKAYEYFVNGRPAIEWIIDQYQVKTDKKSGITDDPNEFSDDPKYILNLLLRYFFLKKMICTLFLFVLKTFLRLE